MAVPHPTNWGQSDWAKFSPGLWPMKKFLFSAPSASLKPQHHLGRGGGHPPDPPPPLPKGALPMALTFLFAFYMC